MYGEGRRAHSVRAAVVVAVATLLALALPVGAPLYAEVYPGPDPATVKEALTTANLTKGFDTAPVTEFETTTFRATVIYGTSVDPTVPTVKIAWSNEAVLAATDEGTFDIQPTSASRQFLDGGTERPNGGFQLTWTWDVTPLVAGKQTLSLDIHPAVVVEGKPLPNLADVNESIPVTIDVHPAQRDFDEVLAAAADMKTDVPVEITVGTEYDISASMSLAGHSDTVSADIELAQDKRSADVTIVEASAAPGGSAQTTAAASAGTVVRRWTMIADEPGQVALVFTATVHGQAAAQSLEQEIPVQATAHASAPAPSFWHVLQQPVLYLAPFVALALGVLGLVAAWKKRKAADDERAAEDPGDPAP